MSRIVIGARSLALVGLATLCLSCIMAADASKGWTTFTNRAGWSIKYPPSWEVGSCNSCTDPTDPHVFVSFFDPSTNGILMIQHLKDKPPDQGVEDWLNDVARVAVANPRLGEEWILLDGRRALKARTPKRRPRKVQASSQTAFPFAED
jgi:hypothetical protein